MKAPIAKIQSFPRPLKDNFPKPSEINYCLSPKHLAVNYSIFEENRTKLIAQFKKDHPDITEGVIFLEGGRTENIHATDNEHNFRQESFFYWAFGVRDPDCFGWIDLSSGRNGLFMPWLPKEYEVWMGQIKSSDDYRREYGVENVDMYFEVSRKIF